MRQVELIFVEANENHNKVYRMTPNADGTWLAEWGRVGNSMQTQTYREGDFEKKYREKLKKGYRDVTELRKEVKDAGFADLTDKAVSALLRRLHDFSSKKVSDNYTVSAAAVTEQQVEEAQAILQSAMAYVDAGSKRIKNREALNKALTSMYAVLPRKMSKVADYIVASGDAFDKAVALLENEQSIVDAMAAQVAVSAKSKKPDGAAQTLADALGISARKADASEEAEIKKLMGGDAHKFSAAFAIENHATRKRFVDGATARHKDWTKMLWHGSRNENWLNILKTGLLIRPTGVVTTGSMFGNGIYFANKAAKSLGYTSARGSYWANGRSDVAYLALFDVRSGNEYRTQKHESWMGHLDAKKLKGLGAYDSFFCKGGVDLRNDELIVYEESQATIKYIVEVRG